MYFLYTMMIFPYFFHEFNVFSIKNFFLFQILDVKKKVTHDETHQ